MMAKTNRGEAGSVRPHPQIPLATCFLAATLLGAAFPAAAFAEAVVSTLPARPEALFPSEAAAPTTPSASHSVYGSGPYASSGGGLVAHRAATVAAVTGGATPQAEAPALL